MSKNTTKTLRQIGQQFIAAGAILAASATPSFADNNYIIRGDYLLIQRLLGVTPLSKEESKTWLNPVPSPEKAERVGRAKAALEKMQRDGSYKGTCSLAFVNKMEPEKIVIMDPPVMSELAAKITAFVTARTHPDIALQMGCDGDAKEMRQRTVALNDAYKAGKGQMPGTTASNLQQSAPGGLSQQVTAADAKKTAAHQGTQQLNDYILQHPNKSHRDAYMLATVAPATKRVFYNRNP